jgi:lipoprotein-anchoring transpeptidase ErfK/SrfK
MAAGRWNQRNRRARVLDSDLSRAGKRDVPTSRRARLGIMAFCGIVALFAAACSSPGGGAKGGSPGQASSPTASPAAQVAIAPANGTTGANPSSGIAVSATVGKITAVTVTTGSLGVGGTMATGGTSWHSNWALHSGASYKVSVTAANKDGKTTTTTSSFRTRSAAGTFSAATVLGNQTYGVGMPISINFSSPVTVSHRAAVEKAIQITTSKPIVGAWMWDGNETLDFRPQVYWPPHTDVSFVAHFNGLEISRGVYGTANLSQSFRIGNSLIGVTSTRTHHTKIYYKGKLYAVWLDSSGMPGDDTANGTYLTIEKANPTLMTGPGYKNVPVYWSVRFTWSGDYYHSAPWSVGEQGYVNVSHGCVNLSPTDAEWYYLRAVPGDPITVTGSPISGAWDDGYTEWFYTWPQVLAHSATHMAVQAGPSGSTLVDPSTLSAQPASTWLTGSKPHNFLAG